MLSSPSQGPNSPGVLGLGRIDNGANVRFDAVRPLVVNEFWRPMPFGSVLSASLFVSIELCMTVLFLLGFLALRFDERSAGALVMSESWVIFLSVCTLVCTARLALVSGQAAVSVLAIAYVLTPVLASLARSVSDDTVSTTVGLLLLLHLASYDYFARDQHRPLVSTNAGLLSAILLCSRLPAYHQVFSVVLLGILVFAVWPMVFVRICAWSPHAHGVLAGVLSGWSALMIFASGLPLWVLYAFLAVLSLVNLVAPVVFFRLQSLKMHLSGQWTEAVVRVKNAGEITAF